MEILVKSAKKGNKWKLWEGRIKMIITNFFDKKKFSLFEGVKAKENWTFGKMTNLGDYFISLFIIGEKMPNENTEWKTFSQLSRFDLRYGMGLKKNRCFGLKADIYLLIK